MLTFVRWSSRIPSNISGFSYQLELNVTDSGMDLFNKRRYRTVSAPRVNCNTCEMEVAGPFLKLFYKGPIPAYAIMQITEM